MSSLLQTDRFCAGAHPQPTSPSSARSTHSTRPHGRHAHPAHFNDHMEGSSQKNYFVYSPQDLLTSVSEEAAQLSRPLTRPDTASHGLPRPVRLRTACGGLTSSSGRYMITLSDPQLLHLTEELERAGWAVRCCKNQLLKFTSHRVLMLQRLMRQGL